MKDVLTMLRKPNIFPLSFAKERERVEIVEIRSGRNAHNRLLSMGIVPGKIYEVIKSAPGPIVLKNGEMRIGIGFGMASKIYVKEVKG